MYSCAQNPQRRQMRVQCFRPRRPVFPARTRACAGAEGGSAFGAYLCQSRSAGGSTGHRQRPYPAPQNGSSPTKTWLWTRSEAGAAGLARNAADKRLLQLHEISHPRKRPAAECARGNADLLEPAGMPDAASFACLDASSARRATQRRYSEADAEKHQPSVSHDAIRDQASKADHRRRIRPDRHPGGQEPPSRQPRGRHQ